MSEVLRLLAGVKSLFRQAFEKSGLSQAELARRLDVFPMHVARLLDEKHSSDLDDLDRATRELGYRYSMTQDRAGILHFSLVPLQKVK